MAERKKTVLYTEFAYLIALAFLAVGTAFMDAADLGMGMVIAPSYVIYLKLSRLGAFVTFGMVAYLFQLILLLILAAVRHRFRLTYLFAFISAFLFGLFLDFFELFILRIPAETLPVRILFYAVGEVFCAAGVSFMFHTYITPEVYELIVKELSVQYGWNINKVKMAYDCASVLLGIVLSFVFFGFGRFEGIKAGTLVCALVNGWLISLCSKINERVFEFRDRLKLRTFFEGINAAEKKEAAEDRENQ